MKWNIALVLFCLLLVTIRYLIIQEHFRPSQADQQIKISKLSVKETRPTGFVPKEKGVEVKVTDNNEVTVISPNNDVSNKKNDSINLQISMYGSKPFKKEKEEFLPSDKIYISLGFSHLEAGTYDIVTHWKTPKGTVARQIVRKVALKTNIDNYRVYFWFQLVENGLFTEMFTGERYKKEVYGQWEVLFFMNNEQIGKKKFMVADM